MNPGTILFSLLAAIAVIAALGMLLSRNAIHAAMFLVLNFLCLALFYLGLDAPFLAMVQITVYAGAIMVLFLFVIMLLGAEEVRINDQTLKWQSRLAAVLVVALLGVVLYLFLAANEGLSLTAVPPLIGETSSAVEGGVEVFGSPQNVGWALFRDYLLPFQVVGLLLLVGMIGAVVLAQESKAAPAPKVEMEAAAGDK
jgi:NADH-quinone oxidoreductase subunit J